MLDADTKDQLAKWIATLPADDLRWLRNKADEALPMPLPTGDGRSTAYRVRLTLFRDGGMEADTDPEIAINQPGTEVIRGLAAVGIWARDITSGWHSGSALGGLSDEDIVRSIKSLRPSLSRNNGTHNWRLPYTVDGHEGYLANILVVTEPDEPTTA